MYGMYCGCGVWGEGGGGGGGREAQLKLGSFIFLFRFLGFLILAMHAPVLSCPVLSLLSLYCS